MSRSYAELERAYLPREVKNAAKPIPPRGLPAEEKKVIYMRDYVKRPGVKKKLLEYRLRPEIKKKQQQYQRDYRALKKRRGLPKLKWREEELAQQ